jgi:polar amino acid transport system substrate-binding protein
MTKIGIFFIAVVTMSVLFLPACGDNKYHNETFVASGHSDWPPIMRQDGDKIVGAGPELVQMIFDELGLDIESRFVGPWDVVQEKARSGEIDLIVAAYKTPERETYMDYSIPYTVDPISIFVQRDNVFSFDSWNDLMGRIGVVTRGDSYGKEFDEFIAENLDVIVADSPDEAFALVIANEADYFVYALYAGEEAMKNNPNLAEQIEILPNEVDAEDFYITISKESRLVAYLPRINEILQRLIDDGTVARLIEKYRNM